MHLTLASGLSCLIAPESLREIIAHGLEVWSKRVFQTIQ